MRTNSDYVVSSRKSVPFLNDNALTPNDLFEYHISVCVKDSERGTSDRDAVRDAVGNAKRNGIKNARFYQGDAGKFMVAMAEEGEKADVVFMDPPRSGSDEAFMNSVVTMQPEKIVYISCNPETQVRDLKYLTKKGYRVVRICPADMFPFTVHCECIVSMTKV